MEVLSFGPSLVLIQLFRRIRSRKFTKTLSPIQQTLTVISRGKSPSASTFEQKNVEGVTKIKSSKQWTLPWWCLFIAYGCSLLLAIVSTFFIIVRGIEFGDSKTQKWLTSLLAGFFSSIFLIQPVKVKSPVGSSFNRLNRHVFFRRLFCWPSFSLAAKEKRIEIPKRLTISMMIFSFIWLMRMLLKKSTQLLKFVSLIRRIVSLSLRKNLFFYPLQDALPSQSQYSVRPRRLDAKTIAKARKDRLNETKMWSIIQEIILYLSFVFCANVVVLSQFQSDAFYHVQHLNRFLSNRRNPTMDYYQVRFVLVRYIQDRDEESSL